MSGAPAEIIAASPFALTDFRATAAWREGLQLRVQAYDTAGAMTENTFTLSTEQSSLITLGLTGLTRIRFSTSGGEESVLDGDGAHFGLDDVNLIQTSNAIEPSPVPLPGAAGLLLAALGAAGALTRRKALTKSI